MNPIQDQLARLPELLIAHLVLSLLALAAAAALALPAGLFLSDKPKGRAVALAGASALQTIPSLALLAVMVPLLGAFGFWPALTALTLYGVLPMLRNTIAGLLAVDPSVLEAARAVGMTPRQSLWRVQLPLALPIVIAGVRTAAVWIVGIATLSTPVGQPSLGNYLFGGLATRNWTAVGVGCVAAAALALLFDTLLALVQTASDPAARLQPGRRRRQLLTGVAGSAFFTCVLCGGLAAARLGVTPDAQRSGQQDSARAPAAGAPSDRAPQSDAPDGKRPIVVGAKGFTEQYILAALLQRRLEANGLAVRRIDSLGSTVIFDALVKGDVDVYVEYTGTLWTNHMKRRDAAPAWQVRTQTASWLAVNHGARQLGTLGFENAYAIAVRPDTAAKLNLHTIQDLGAVAARLSLGSDYEFFDRPEWTHLRTAYHLGFRELQTFDPTFMYEALVSGKVDAITAFSSDGRIAAFDLQVLSDPQRALPPYEAVILLSPRAAALEAVEDALSPLLSRVSVGSMRAANLRVDGEQTGETPHRAAEWLDLQLAETVWAR